MRKRLHGKTIVVAEDRMEMREMLADVLTEAGATVVRCADGAEALDWIERYRVHAIVADLRMPTMNGHELIRRVRTLADARKRSLPAIAITGDEALALRDPAVSAMVGFDYHLVKPVDVRLLVDVLAARIAATSAN